MLSLRPKCALGIAIAFIVLSQASTSHGQQGLERTILLRQDLPIAGYEVIVMSVTLTPGGREGRHTHFGTLVGHLVEGELTLEQEGLPTRVLKPGETGAIDAGRAHEGSNRGTVPTKVLATFIVEKGKPLSTPVP